MFAVLIVLAEPALKAIFFFIYYGAYNKLKHTLELEQYKFRVCFLYCWKNQQPKLFQKIHKIWHRGSFFTGFVHGISDKGIYHTMYFIPIVLHCL